MYTVRLENTVTHQIYEQQVEDTNDGGKLYFRFGISTIDLADGEYILTVFGENGDVLAEDLLRIGDFNPQTLQYTKGEKTYLDITVDAILQREKNVSITDIHTRILPDLGNDAVEIVYVDAQPLYDSARSEGYDEGYDLGIQQSYPKGYEDGYNKGTEDGFVAGTEDAYPKGYDDGYNKGTEDGYNTGSAEAYPKGYESGYDVGKTDGYNEGYDVGSMDMHLEMLEETRILNVTENGRYITKYTEDPYIPTGDGDFGNFCKLTNTTYQMGRLKSNKEAQETGSDVIEFWWRPKDLAYNHRPMILMSTSEDDGNGIHHSFSINLLTYDREDKLRFHTDAGGWTSVDYIISSDPEMWYHISIQNSELYINDEFISKFYIVNDNETSYIYLNGDSRTEVEDGIDECNGYFGMVKINGEVFIPTENGYMDQNKGNIIQPIADGEYEFFLQRDPEGGLYRTVNVNIDTKQYFLEGYDEGYSTGYNVGEQASFGNGYEQGQKDIAENARVLEVTENGNYLSKFSEPIIPTLVTGVYDDGTEFYSYAELNGKVFNTNITPTSITRLELWYKGDNLKAADGWHNIISAEKYHIRYHLTSNSKIQITVGQPSITYDWDENVWHHILIAKETEDASYLSVWVDEVKIGNLSNPSFTSNSTFYINGIEDVLVRNANGSFGMIKIDDTTIIPTEEGFLNVNTGELLEIVKDGVYVFTDNSIKYGEGELYKTINVNVVPKINIAEIGIKFAYSNFSEVPNWADFKNITDMNRMFYSCTYLQELPYIDTSNVTVMANMCSNCILLKTIPAFNTSNVTTMEYMLSDCPNIQTIPYIDTSNVTNMYNMFYSFGGIKTLVSLPKFECGKVGNMSWYFSYYADGMSSLTDVGGWNNLKCDWNDNYGLRACPNLTYQSCINILNGLYDFVGNGESTTRTLKVNPNFLTTVGDDISIGTNKGWIITT